MKNKSNVNHVSSVSKTNLPGITVVTCTNRPKFFTQLLDNFTRQKLKLKELIVVLNHDQMKLSAYRKKVSNYKHIKVLQLPSKASLGDCLNFAIAAASHKYIAKFDDDDFYGPNYLKRQLQSIIRTDADIVGKRACLTFLEANKQLILRYPNHQNRFVRAVAGSTLLMKKSLVKLIPFGKNSPGESVAFMQKCRANGFKIYSTDCADYVTLRRKDKHSHTWKINDKQIKLRSTLVAKNCIQYQKYAALPAKEIIKEHS